MTTRTRRFAAHFPTPFTLRHVDGLVPVGTYALDQFEESITDGAALAYRVTGLFLYVVMFSQGHWKIEHVQVNAAEIEAAILEELHKAGGFSTGKMKDFDT